MNSSLTSSLSEFTKKSDFSKSPLSSAPPRRPTVGNLFTRARLWLGKLGSSAYTRGLTIFVVGFAAGLAWMSYGGAARKQIAGWSPRLSWLAPAPGDTSRERIKAMSLAVATARQSLDKLATEIGKLPVQDANAPRRRTAR